MREFESGNVNLDNRCCCGQVAQTVDPAGALGFTYVVHILPTRTSCFYPRCLGSDLGSVFAAFTLNKCH